MDVLELHWAKPNMGLRGVNWVGFRPLALNDMLGDLLYLLYPTHLVPFNASML
jgi:hypothetical protein